MDRRLDIQGLRGVAVIAVILYHFSIPPMSGGFVGVDIFFVISGYLMTGIILTHVEKGDWSYSAFFMRRVRRLFPALFLTAAIVFAVGVLIFAAFDLERLAQVSLLAPLGLSNIFFWAEAGYFDSEAIRKPLLHTWSLAVEIQFYVIWPFVILLGARMGRRGLAVLITLIGTISAWAGLVAMGTEPSQAVWFMEPTGAFFMMPLRGYEFCIGGLAYLSKGVVPQNVVLRQGLYGVALICLAATFVMYSKLTPFPGVATFPVIVATAVLLWIGPSTALSKIVSNKPLCVLGDVSYSAYLAHWPVVVFAGYLMSDPATPLQTVGLLTIVALATVTLFYGVEQPLRRGDSLVWGKWRVSVLAVIVMMTLPLHAWVKDGWPGRGPEALYSLNTLDMWAMEKSLWPYFNELQRQQDYVSEKPNVLVIGDSQAADYVNVLQALGAEDDVDIITRTIFTTCNIPYLEGDRLETFLTKDNTFSIKEPNLQKECPRLMREAVTGPAWDNADVVVLAFAWRDTSLKVMADSFAQLAARTDAQIYAVGNKTLKASPVQLANQLGTTEGLGDFAYENIRHWTPPTNAFIEQNETVEMIDILSLFCVKDDCRVLNDEGRPLMWDETHFSEWGVRFVAERGGREHLMPFLN